MLARWGVDGATNALGAILLLCCHRISLGLLSNAKLGLGLLKGRNLPFGHCERSGGYRKRALRGRVAHLPAPKTLDLCQWGVRRQRKRNLKHPNSAHQTLNANPIAKQFLPTP